MSMTSLTTACINDGEHSKFKQETPKARIIAALQQIKAKGTK